MKIQTFIFLHDQRILTEFLKVGKFNSLPNVKYVFVGDKPVDQIENLENVIVCRNLPINIEQYPKFTSFTGWYALWKNNLIDADYLNLFEYDINISNTLGETIQSVSENSKPDFIGYIPLWVTVFDYVDNLDWVSEIIPSIKKHYGVDIYEVINEVKSKKYDDVWSCTSNSTFSRQTFEEYMIWFEKLIEDLKDTRNCGHAHERSLSFFYFMYNKNVTFIQNQMKHFQSNSHGTQGHHVDFENLLKNLTS